MKSKGYVQIRFTGFYRYLELNLRNNSWDILRTVGTKVGEDWINRGDFNKIVNDVEKCGGLRKLRVMMDEF